MISKSETLNSKLETALNELRKVYNVARPFRGPGNELDIELQPPEMHGEDGHHAYEKILAKHGLIAHGFIQAAPWKSRFLRGVREITADLSPEPSTQRPSPRTQNPAPSHQNPAPEAI